MITRSVVRDWLLAYLNREIDAAYLAQWAQMILAEGQIFRTDELLVRHVLAQLRWLPLPSKGLTWEELYDLLQLLGYQPRVTAAPLSEEEYAISTDDTTDPGSSDDSTAPW